MTGVSRKPALFAGFLLVTTALITSAQDYVDVEAERRAQEAERRAEAVQSACCVSACRDSDCGPAASIYSGIQPYSGTTTVAQVPVDCHCVTHYGHDSGSMVLRVQQLETDVRRLNGQLEEALQALRQLEAQTLERYVDIDRRLAAGNGAGGDAGSAADAGSLGDALSETNGSQETIQSASTSPASMRKRGRRPLIAPLTSWFGSNSLMMPWLHLTAF